VVDDDQVHAHPIPDPEWFQLGTNGRERGADSYLLLTDYPVKSLDLRHEQSVYGGEMSGQPGESRSAQILLVGDREAVEETVDGRLRALHELHQVGSGADAVEAASRSRFGAVVLFELGAGEGPDFTLLRSLVALQRDAAIVVVSSAPDPRAAERAFSLGAHSFLLTPLSSRQLEISLAGRLRQCRDQRSQVRSLHDFQARVEEMIEQAPMPMFLKDRDGRYVLANAETNRYFGFEPGHLVGLTGDDVFPEEGAAEARAEDARVLELGAEIEEERSLNFAGQQRTFLVNKFPFRNAHGEIVGVFGMTVDVTERKVSEALRAAFAAEQRNLIFELQRSREETADRLSRALHYRDSVSGEHVSRMAIVAAYLGERLGMSPEEVILLRAATPMHDIGKIAIPDDILQKPGRLTEDERRVMQRHPQIGFEMLDGSHSEVLRMGAQIALTHHERWDGRGYPRRLRGEQIPLEGRIAAVADVFDALLSDRPYRAALRESEVREVIADGRGSLFDPQVANALLDEFETALRLRNPDGGSLGESSLASFIDPAPLPHAA
jgi:PAS domain S-box-containing protein